MSSFNEISLPCIYGNCGSTHFTTDDNGTTETCENGHTRARFANSEEIEDYHLLGTTTTKKKEKIAKVSRFPKGRSQVNLLIHCHQWILRKQVWWLIHEKHFPPELEELVRALWEQRLNFLVDKFDDEATREFTAGDSDSDGPERSSRHKIQLGQLPVICETLSLCLLGTYILRLPIFPGDILRWVEDQDLTYLAASSILPKEMVTRLKAESLVYLKDKSPLTIQRLGLKTAALFRAYERDIGLQLPSLNLPLCLYRCIQDLALPIEVYPTVKHLAGMVKYNFIFPTRQDAGWLNHVPERRLAGFLVVAVKLLYPFDDKPRYPYSEGEPAAAVMNWKNWIELKNARARARKDADALDFDAHLKTTEAEVFDMTDDRMDKYMDWFAKTWAKTGEESIIASKDDYAKNMIDLFPIGDMRKTDDTLQKSRTTDTYNAEHLREVQKNMISREPAEPMMDAYNNDQVNRPGRGYMRYRNYSEVSGIAKEFYDAVASYIGLPAEDLVYITFDIEKRLEDWMAEQRRKKRPREESDTNQEEDEEEAEEDEEGD